MKMYLFWTATTIIAAVPLYFVYHKIYDDGVWGRLGLLGISFASCALLFDTVLGPDSAKYDPPAMMVMLHVCLAIFLIWHLARFHRRLGQVKKPPYCPPDCPADRRHRPDRRFITE